MFNSSRQTSMFSNNNNNKNVTKKVEIMRKKKESLKPHTMSRATKHKGEEKRFDNEFSIERRI